MKKLILALIIFVSLACACRHASVTPRTPASAPSAPLKVTLRSNLPTLPPAGPLPVYALSDANPPRAELLRLMQFSYPGAALKLQDEARFDTSAGEPVIRTTELAMFEGRLIARLEKSGDVALIPRLSNLSSLRKADPAKLLNSAQAALVRLDLQQGKLEQQANIRFKFEAPLFAYRSDRRRDGVAAGESEPELMYARARRLVGEYPVVGSGSNATVMIDADGVQRGIRRTWRAAEEQAGLAQPPSGEDLERSIRSQFEKSGAKSVSIESVDIVYYDANAKYLQPAYRFVAHVDTGGQRPRIAIGYVAFHSELALDELPSLESVVTDLRASEQAQKMQRRSAARPLHVGRFVASGNERLPFGASARDFWNELRSEPSRFENTRFEPAATREVLISRAGALDLVLVEGHGIPATVFMNSTDGQEVRFGTDPIEWPADKERAADWIIHSCEVVTAPPEAAEWDDPWWSTFHHVRSVVGYWTRMEIADQVVRAYGDKLADGESIASAWLSAAADAYDGELRAEMSTGTVRPLGRPAVITLCGHEDDTVDSNVERDAPSCLRVRYLDDVL